MLTKHLLCAGAGERLIRAHTRGAQAAASQLTRASRSEDPLLGQVRLVTGGFGCTLGFSNLEGPGDSPAYTVSR